MPGTVNHAFELRAYPPTDLDLMQQFQAGCEHAATLIYQRYSRRLRALARTRCSRELSARVDPDDIVQSVFQSFFQAVRQGRIEIDDHDALWKVLLVIALNKVRTLRAYHRAAKRDVRATRGGEFFERTVKNLHARSAASGQMGLLLQETLDQLPAPRRQVVELRGQGFEVAEIASMTERSTRTVERWLQDARARLGALVATLFRPSAQGP